MPAPVASFIRLEPDTSNTGKKLRTIVRPVAATDVHEHHLVLVPQPEIRNAFHAASAVQSVQATAQNGTSTGFVWLELPVAQTGTRGRLRRVDLYFTTSGTTAMLTVPRIVVQHFTFTGTASGASITPARAQAGTAPLATARTATFGMSVTLGQIAYSFLAPNVLTGISVIEGAQREFRPPSPEARIEFAAGEGIVIYQPDAGTASDQRRFTLQLAWEELDVA